MSERWSEQEQVPPSQVGKEPVKGRKPEEGAPRWPRLKVSYSSSLSSALRTGGEPCP